MFTWLIILLSVWVGSGGPRGRTVWKDSLEAQALGASRASQGRGRAGSSQWPEGEPSSRVAVVEEAWGRVPATPAQSLCGKVCDLWAAPRLVTVGRKDGTESGKAFVWLAGTRRPSECLGSRQSTVRCDRAGLGPAVPGRALG